MDIKGSSSSPFVAARRPLMKALDAVGLGEPLREAKRRAKRFSHAAGLSTWEPLVPEDAFLACVDDTIRAVRQANGENPFGDYFEFGVSRGTSLSLVYRALSQQGLDDARLIGFDSFEGLPKAADEEGWHEGEFRSTVGATRRYLRRRKVDLQRVTFVEGWYSDTLNEETRRHYKLGPASLITIDCDIYSASKQALTFSAPHLATTAAIIFDDWGWSERRGEVGQKEAFSEFLTEYPQFRAAPLPSYREEAKVFLIQRQSTD